MRISTGQIFQNSLNSLLDQQARVMQTQQQLATGKRIQSPADDPAGAAMLLGLDQTLQVTQQYQQNISFARTQLNQTESVLMSVSDVLDNVRALALQANNATMTESDRRMVAVEMRQQLDELLSLANTRNASGEYLFAGYQGQTRPFSFDSDGNTVYHGDEGQRFVQTGASRQVAATVSGAELFMAIPRSNGVFVAEESAGNSGTGVIDPGSVTDHAAWDGGRYTISFTDRENYVVADAGGDVVASGIYEPGSQIAFRGIETRIGGTPEAGDSFDISPAGRQDMFRTIEALVSVLEAGAGAGESAMVANATNRFLADVDQSLENVLAIRARTGAHFKSLDSQEVINDEAILRTREVRSQVEDLDYASAITQLTRQLVGLEAAQKSFIQVQGLSLFNFL